MDDVHEKIIPAFDLKQNMFAMSFFDGNSVSMRKVTKVNMVLSIHEKDINDIQI